MQVPGRVCQRLGIEVPLLLAGMGGIAGPELAASVSNHGAAGCLGLYKMPPDLIPSAVEAVERLTARAYGVNFVPEVMDEEALANRVRRLLDVSRSDVYVSFFGLPPADLAKLVRGAGRQLVIQVGTEQEAVSATRLGADVLILQGTGAGGHLLGSDETMALLRRIRRMLPDAALAVAGGIGRGRDFVRYASEGADAACCGTLFVTTHESRAHDHFKTRVVAASPEDTVVTDLYEIGWPGRVHRVIQTERVKRGASDPRAFIARTTVYDRTQLIPRYAAAVPTTQTEGAVEEMALYCGVSCGAVQASNSAGATVNAFRREIDEFD